jgi:hypothetical protein
MKLRGANILLVLLQVTWSVYSAVAFGVQTPVHAIKPYNPEYYPAP